MPPIVIVQHIPPVFSTAFAKRLNEHLPLEVKEAVHGDELRENLVLIAPGGFHMEVHESGGRRFVKVFEGANVTGHKPSVDVLFTSMAATFAQRGVGVILTGMGKDGAQGLLQMQKSGAETIGQDEASCVVYGMPHVAFKLGAVNHVVTLTEIPAQIMKCLTQKKSKRAS
jgi:two-component system chemotaxis response regulator CheB